MNYTTSIINKFGDIENIRRDSKTLFEIQSRQGSSLLIEIIAESVGTASNKFKLSEEERSRLRETLVRELDEAIKERT